jgi:NADPH-dependent glutamate synthase beta subunit-like oxidoreductase
MLFIVMPEFKVEPPHSIVAEQGQVVTIDCVAMGEPEPDMTWHKGRIRNVIQSEDRMTILANNSLRFG